MKTGNDERLEKALRRAAKKEIVRKLQEQLNIITAKHCRTSYKSSKQINELINELAKSVTKTIDFQKRAA